MTSDQLGLDREDPRAHLIALMNDLPTVMVATKDQGGPMHARPMAIAQVTDTGEVWFVTSRASAKVDEVAADARALVTGQKGNEFFSVSGSFVVVDDRQKVQRLWKDEWKIWFKNGKDDPNIVFLRFLPTVGEYWDQSGTKGLRYLFEAAKAYVTGDTIDPQQAAGGKDGHAKVSL